MVNKAVVMFFERGKRYFTFQKILNFHGSQIFKKFCKLKYLKNFAGMNFREWPEHYDFAGINFRERP